MDPSTSGSFQDDDSVEDELYDATTSDINSETIQKVLLDRRKRDYLARLKASRAAINKRRLHGAQGTEVDWEDRQLCMLSGQHCSESYSNSYVQVKKPLTELIENPTGCRKSVSSLGGYERIACSQNGKLKNVYELTLFDDIMSFTHQDSDSFSQLNNSNLPKVAMKRVSSDETLNEVLGRGINKHIFSLNKSSHKGIKYRKSRENLEIRRRHSSMGGSVSGEEFSYYPRRTLWRKFSNCQLGLNGANGDLIQDADFHNELVSYDDDKYLIQEKRVRRSSIGDISFIKEDLQNGESNLFNDHSMPNKYVLVNTTKLFVREDFATRLSSGEFGCFNKTNNFGEELWAPGNRNSEHSRPKYPVNDQSSLGKWSNISEISSGFSVVGQRMSCEVPLNMMTNIYPSTWGESDIMQSVNFTKTLGELKMSPIYQSHSGANNVARKSCSDWPIRKWSHQRCLPKIPQLWKEDRNFSSSGDATKETEEEKEPFSTSSELGLIESDEASAVDIQDKEKQGKEEDTTGNEDECCNEYNNSELEKGSVQCAEKPASDSALQCIPYIPLRVSLFPFVPPYICFGKHDKPGPPIHADIRSIAKWKLGKFTPTIVQIIVKNTGLDAVRHCDEYVGIWAKNLSPSGFTHVKESQKINHIPGGFYIGRKDSLCNNLKKMKNVFGTAEYYFVPETYVLPGDIYFLKQEWDEAEGNKESTKWIVKPPAGARGSGVSVIHSWGQIPHSKPIVVQKYIANPYLIDHTKFDLRVYVLITSVHPLRMYVYSEGLVRFASDIYSPDTSTLSDKYVHLTNYSVNKKSSRYMANQDPTACQGHKWTLSSLWNYLNDRHVNVDGLWKQITDIAIKTFLSGESSIARCTNACLNSNYPAYELFGLDIILDEELKPWLLEVNISPSLNTSSKLDMSVKGPMMTELLNLVGYHLPPTTLLSLTEKREIIRKLMCRQLSDLQGPSEGKVSPPYPGLLFDKRIYTKALSSEEKRKHLAYTDMFSNQDLYCDTILKILMPDDVRHLLIAEDELSQAKRFQRVFPTPGMQKYYKFFSGPRYYNMLYEAWEKRYHDNRLAGIELLQELCRNRLHLRTPLSMSSLKYGVRAKLSRESIAQRKLREDIAQKKAKEDVVKKKSNNNVKKKSKERVSVKTKKRTDPCCSSFSGQSNEKSRAKPSKTVGFPVSRKTSSSHSLRVCRKRSQARVLGFHCCPPRPLLRTLSAPVTTMLSCGTHVTTQHIINPSVPEIIKVDNRDSYVKTKPFLRKVSV